ncbi:MAG: DVU_1556 family methyltransferase [Lentihominibacter sp.]|jgi:ubiquinone/menaquinone biosynthesis C-methylase UbiE
MTIQRPGEFRITDAGLGLAGLPEGGRVLDVGCGEGDTVNYLNEKGFKAEGIDLSLPKISAAKEKFPGIDVKYGDGEILDEYTSFTFDGITMECVLSLINLPDEALHEAYCVLKKGGKLIINDLYEINPDPLQVKAVAIEADRVSRLPHEHEDGECEERGERPVPFRFGGVFFKEELIAQMEETGFRVIAFEDRTVDLDSFVAQSVMDGKEDIMSGLCNNLQTEINGKKRRIGYFLLVVQKPI